MSRNPGKRNEHAKRTLIERWHGHGPWTKRRPADSLQPVRFWLITLVVVAAAVGACSDGAPIPAGPSTPRVANTELPRPAGVPVAAQFVADDTVFGAPGDADASRLFFSADCREDILTIVTTREILYAELPCDRALPQKVAARFLGLAVRERVVVGNPSKLYVDSTSAGTLEFTIGRLWVVNT